MPLAILGMSLIHPAAAVLPVAPDAFAPSQVAADADLQDRVVAGVEHKREATRVGFPRRRWHDGGVENGDEGSWGEFPEPGVGGGEEIQVQRPFKVRKRKDHVFPSSIHFAIGGFGERRRGLRRGFMPIFVRQRRGFGCDDAEDYEIVFQRLGQGEGGGFNGGEERGNKGDVFLADGVGKEGVGD